MSFEQISRDEAGYQEGRNAAQQHRRKQPAKSPVNKIEQTVAFEESQGNHETRDDKKQSDTITTELKERCENIAVWI
jgi:hypothetical protein